MMRLADWLFMSTERVDLIKGPVSSGLLDHKMKTKISFIFRIHVLNSDVQMIYFIFVSKQAVGKCPPVNKHEPSPFNQPKAADPPTCCLSTHYNEKQGRLVCLTKFCAAVGRLFSDCIAPSNICLFVNIVDSKLHFFTFTYLLP